MTARDPAYLAWVRQQPCCVCAAPSPSDPHHRIGNRHSAARVSDRETMPLCRPCHVELHAGWKRWEDAHGSQDGHIKRTLLVAIDSGQFGTGAPEGKPMLVLSQRELSRRSRPAVRNVRTVGGGKAKRESPTATPGKIAAQKRGLAA